MPRLPLPRWLRRLTGWLLRRGRKRDPRHELGQRGEKAAAHFLRRQGYKVLFRNFRAPHGGEVDITCRHGDTLVFEEVKTRTVSADATRRPADAVNHAKRKLITRGARAWLRMLDDHEIAYRFDIVEVSVAPGKKPTCNVIQSAFTLPGRFLY